MRLVYLLDYLVFLHKKVMLHQKEHSKHLTLQMHAPFSAACDDKINDCGFNFSVVCEWRVLIEEDKDNSLQFAKVFPIKFLKLLICQSFPLPLFCTIRYY